MLEEQELRAVLTALVKYSKCYPDGEFAEVLMNTIDQELGGYDKSASDIYESLIRKVLKEI